MFSPVKFAKFLRTSFFKEFQWLLLRFVTHVFKGIQSKAGATLRNRYQIQLKKRYLLLQKSWCSVKEDRQRPAKVFSC